MAGKLRFGIIGCGRIAERHAQYSSRVGSLVAVCDIVKERAIALAATCHAQPYYSIEALLAGEQLDVVAVCTPNGLHALHSIQALEAGLHVLCEKPMAIRTADCCNMMAAAGKAGRQLMIVKQNRFNPPVAALKKLLAAGSLGKIFSVQVNAFWNRGAAYYKDSSWRGTKALDGGTLFTQFSHFADLLYWLLGDVQEVQAIMANYAHKGMIEFEDTGSVLLQFASGVTGTLNYTVNSYAKNMEGSLTLFAENATIKIGGEYLNELSYQATAGPSIAALPAGAPANDYGAYRGSMSNHDKVYDNLADVIENNATVAASAFEGMKTVELIEKIYAAAKFV